MDHVGGYLGGQEPHPKGGGVDVVEDSFDVWEEGGDLESRSLEGSNCVAESEPGVRGAKPWKRPALVRMKEALGPGDGRKPDRHYTFENL